jgi:hypothetical protein
VSESVILADAELGRNVIRVFQEQQDLIVDELMWTWDSKIVELIKAGTAVPSYQATQQVQYVLSLVSFESVPRPDSQRSPVAANRIRLVHPIPELGISPAPQMLHQLQSQRSPQRR